MPNRSTTGRRTRRRATLQSVADAVGVSIQTVANSLRHPERVAEATRQRVIAEVRRQDYRPNTAGRSLRTNRVDLLAACVSRPLSDGSVDAFLRAAAPAAQRYGFHLLAFTEEMESIGAVYDELLRTHAVDGFVLTGTEIDDPRHVWLHDRDVPFVAIGRRWTTELGPFVDFDGIDAMCQLADHLLERGRRRFAWVGPAAASGPVAERLVGLDQALAGSGADLVAAHAVDSPDRVDVLADVVVGEAIDAVVCADDRYAAAIVTALTDADIAVGPGETLAVTGYGNTELARLLGITTVADPIADAARTAVQMLTTLVDDPETSIEAVMLAPALLPRHTA